MPLTSPLSYRRWADFTSRDFAQLPREQLVAVLPVGAIEQHGPHLPMAVDAAIIDTLVDEVIERLPDTSPAIFLPTCPIGSSGEHSDFPGTLSVSARTLMSLWTDIGESVARAGVRKLVFFNSHGGQVSAMDIVGHDLRTRLGLMVVSTNWFSLGLPAGLFSERDLRFGIHGGDLESSLMLAISPALVHQDAFLDFPSRNEVLAQTNRHLGVGAGGRIGWQTQDLNPAGAVGEAHLATADKGRTVIEFVADRMVELLDEVDRFPLALQNNPPAWK